MKTRENEQMKRDLCDFSTASSKGLKTHIKRKHTEKIQEIVPLKFEVCKEELENKTKMRNHMLANTYTYTNNDGCKCEEYDFIERQTVS